MQNRFSHAKGSQLANWSIFWLMYWDDKWNIYIYRSSIFYFRGSDNFVIFEHICRIRKENVRLISCDFVTERVQSDFEVDTRLCSRDLSDVVSFHILLMHFYHDNVYLNSLLLGLDIIYHDSYVLLLIVWLYRNY